jgi:hypothetical protein
MAPCRRVTLRRGNQATAVCAGADCTRQATKFTLRLYDRDYWDFV